MAQSPAVAFTRVFLRPLEGAPCDVRPADALRSLLASTGPLEVGHTIRCDQPNATPVFLLLEDATPRTVGVATPDTVAVLLPAQDSSSGADAAEAVPSEGGSDEGSDPEGDAWLDAVSARFFRFAPGLSEYLRGRIAVFGYEALAAGGASLPEAAAAPWPLTLRGAHGADGTPCVFAAAPALATLGWRVGDVVTFAAATPTGPAGGVSFSVRLLPAAEAAVVAAGVARSQEPQHRRHVKLLPLVVRCDAFALLERPAVPVPTTTTSVPSQLFELHGPPSSPWLRLRDVPRSAVLVQPAGTSKQAAATAKAATATLVTLRPLTRHDWCGASYDAALRRWLRACANGRRLRLGEVLTVPRHIATAVISSDTKPEFPSHSDAVEAVDSNATVVAHSIADPGAAVADYAAGAVALAVAALEGPGDVFDAASTAVSVEARPSCGFLPRFHRRLASPQAMPLPDAVCPRLQSHRALALALQRSLDQTTSAASCSSSCALTVLRCAAANWGLARVEAAAEAIGVPLCVVGAGGSVAGTAGGAAAGATSSRDDADAALVATAELNAEWPAVIAVTNAERLHPTGIFGRWLQRPGQRVGSSSSGVPPPSFRIVLLFEGADPVPPYFLGLATTSIEVPPPGDADRATILAEGLARIAAARACRPLRYFDQAPLVPWCVGLSCADIVGWLHTTACEAVSSGVASFATAAPAGVAVFDEAACEAGLRRFQSAHGLSVTSSKLQPVKWSDVGGLEGPKREILGSIQLPMLHPELFVNTRPRAGILLYGPPGCGKTLLAKAVATELAMNFLSVKGPELINMYVGESERNIRQLFQRARDCAPCIVFFDEIDALAPARGSKGDAGGVMDRIVAQLLAEVDGVAQGGGGEGGAAGDALGSGEPQQQRRVFIVGATNRPDLLDPSLMRPGRFDRLCYLGIPGSNEEQLWTVRALTRKFRMAPDVDLAALVATLQPVFTGADLFALCSDAMMLAVDEVVAAATAELADALAAATVSEGDAAASLASPTAAAVLVRQRHFLAARAKLIPSVTVEDLRRYESMKTQFESSSGSK